MATFNVLSRLSNFPFFFSLETVLFNMAKNSFSCADIRFRESKSAPASSSKTKTPARAYIEPKFRRGRPEEHDGLKVWQAKRDVNFRGYGNQIYHNPKAHPRFYATKLMVVHQRKKVVGKDAKAEIGKMHEDSRRNQRATVAEESFNNTPKQFAVSGFMGCSLRNKTPIIDYAAAEIHDMDFTFSGVVSVDDDIKYNCSFFPSEGPKMIDLKRYNDYIDLFLNYSGKQLWQLSEPFQPKTEKAGLFWAHARDFRQTHPIKVKTEWNEKENIVPAEVEPEFIPPTGIDDVGGAASTVSCSTVIAAANPIVLPADARKCLPAIAQPDVIIDLLSVDTSDEAESLISVHSLPPNVLVEPDSSSDENLDITIPELPEAIFADAVGVFDETTEDEGDQVVPLPWQAANDSLDVEVGDNFVQGELVVIPPTAVPAQLVLTKKFKHPFISDEPQAIRDNWQLSTDEEHDTYLAYGTELPSSPFELLSYPLDNEHLKVKLMNLQLLDENRDLKSKNETLKNATSTKSFAILTGTISELVKDREMWKDRAAAKAAGAANLAVSLSAIHDVLDDVMWLRGANPLGFTVNSENTFHPRFGEACQVLAKQVRKDESRDCPNTFDKCDPTSKHQCFNCISSFRISACMAIALEGLLKSEMSIIKFQRISSEPSALEMIELGLAKKKRPSVISSPLGSKPKLSKNSPEIRVLSNDLTLMEKPSFNTPKRFSQSSVMESNVNNKTVDERTTQDFAINVHASDSDDYDPR